MPIRSRIPNSKSPDATPVHRPHVTMTMQPTVTSVKFDDLTSDYSADDIINVLAEFTVRARHLAGTLTRCAFWHATAQFHLPMQALTVYHKIRVSNPDQHKRDNPADILDIVHVRPAWNNSRHRTIPGKLNTVLVEIGDSLSEGIRISSKCIGLASQ